MPDSGVLEVRMPEKIRHALFAPGYRYRIIKGGRGKGGSWSIARALLTKGYAEPKRILCCREIQKSIDESVYQLLLDQIDLLGLASFYQVYRDRIVGQNGTVFIFEGLRALDVVKIKSFEAVDIVWVEEAQVITKRSWDILIPTIRKEGSEIWVNFNPELDTDETYDRFVTHSPPRTIVCEVSWRDNPFFPDVLQEERRYASTRNKEDYENIWEGKCRSAVPGAIYADEIREAFEKKRVRPMPYDPKLKVHVIWDLGFNDLMSIGFVQRLNNALMFVDYMEDNRKKYDWFAARIKEKRYNLGKFWLPHDGGHDGAANIDTPQRILQSFSFDVEVAPREVDKEQGIKRTRQVFPQIYFDDGPDVRVLLEHLRRYRRNIPVNTNEPSTPIHDEHSHAADMVRLMSLVAPQLENDDEGFFSKKLVYDNRGIV